MRDEPESLDEQALQEKRKFTGDEQRKILSAMLRQRMHKITGVEYEPPDYQSAEEDRLLDLFQQYEERIPDDDI